MKKILQIVLASLLWVHANQYNIYDMNGKKQGSYNGELSKQILMEFSKKNHGSVLVKKGAFNKTINLKNLSLFQQKTALENSPKRIIDIQQDSSNKELWQEVEKNEIIKLCIDKKVLAWETSLNSQIENDSCLTIQVPTLIGIEPIKIHFTDIDSTQKINLAIGMKYLNFKNEEVLLGYKERPSRINPPWICRSFREADPERLISVTGTYLVDKRPVTQCEIVQLMWDSIPNKVQSEDAFLKNGWISRKKTLKQNGICEVQDSAANTISVYQAMKYANARSIRDGLKPYYTFSATDAQYALIHSKGQYDICNSNFTIPLQENKYIHASVNYSSDGYRLLYYDEWMMFARGGDKKNKAPWGDSSMTFEEVSKYAKFTYNENDELYDAGLVGQLKPNGYGLYDIFGLVEEHVLFEEFNPFCYLKAGPSCFKGGNTHISYTWKEVNYGYRTANYTNCQPGGFRLIRNIGNNAKWSEVKSDKE